VWGQAFGAWGNTNGNGNAASLDRSASGFFIGADAPVFNTWRFGAVAGYSRSDIKANGPFSSGWSDNAHVGLYGGTAWSDFAFRTGAAYTWHGIETQRSVSLPGFNDNLKGAYDAATAQAFGEFGYDIEAGNATFEPFANLAYVNLRTDGFTEKGGGAALKGQAATTDTAFTTLGLHGAAALDPSGARLTAKGMLGWRHALGGVTPEAAMRFAAGGDAFTVRGVPIARDAAVAEAGIAYTLSSTAMLGITYGGQFGDGATDQSFKASFNVKF
jgi:outer membrane autotransporter protein